MTLVRGDQRHNRGRIGPHSLLMSVSAGRLAADAAGSQDHALCACDVCVETLRHVRVSRAWCPCANAEDQAQIVLRYFSAFDSFRGAGYVKSGVAFMVVDPAEGGGHGSARAIIGSFSIES